MILNLLWVVLGGLPMALAWWLAALICAITIVGLPWARSCWVVGCFSLWPFGSEAVSRRQLRGRGDLGTGPLGALGNVLWFPVALGLTLFLLYPGTMARIGLAAAITFLVGGLLLAGVLGLAMVWLIQWLF